MLSQVILCADGRAGALRQSSRVFSERDFWPRQQRRVPRDFYTVGSSGGARARVQWERNLRSRPEGANRRDSTACNSPRQNFAALSYCSRATVSL